MQIFFRRANYQRGKKQPPPLPAFSYRSITPKARIIPLTAAFVDYLREDGIVLPDDDDDDADNGRPRPSWTDHDSGVFSDGYSAASGNDGDGDDEDDDDNDALLDPSEHFRDVHVRIKETIAELGGRVAPKLNWSAPKDAAWISATNSMECRSANDVYLLLKSSDFVTHDLEHAFDGCQDQDAAGGATTTDATDTTDTAAAAAAAAVAAAGEVGDGNEKAAEEEGEIGGGAAPEKEEASMFSLVLRKWLLMNPSVEFRCFVQARTLVAVCQRDLNHFDFLFPMADEIRVRIQEFFDSKLKHTFPDENFVFDVYIPPPHKRVWLIDVNPWAPRTDPLLFSWLELLHIDSSDFQSNKQGAEDETSRPGRIPEIRLVKKDDPEAYGFTTPQYSAHKLPKDVVDASRSGPGPLREFADQWKQALEQRIAEDDDSQ